MNYDDIIETCKVAQEKGEIMVGFTEICSGVEILLGNCYININEFTVKNVHEIKCLFIEYDCGYIEDGFVLFINDGDITIDLNKIETFEVHRMNQLMTE